MLKNRTRLLSYTPNANPIPYLNSLRFEQAVIFDHSRIADQAESILRHAQGLGDQSTQILSENRQLAFDRNVRLAIGFLKRVSYFHQSKLRKPEHLIRSRLARPSAVCRIDFGDVNGGHSGAGESLVGFQSRNGLQSNFLKALLHFRWRLSNLSSVSGQHVRRVRAGRSTLDRIWRKPKFDTVATKQLFDMSFHGFGRLRTLKRAYGEGLLIMSRDPRMGLTSANGLPIQKFGNHNDTARKKPKRQPSSR